METVGIAGILQGSTVLYSQGSNPSRAVAIYVCLDRLRVSIGWTARSGSLGTPNRLKMGQTTT